MSQTTSFYAVADRRAFVGLVAMLNSLRLAGHEEPLVVLDAGLEPRQRELLSAHATLLPAVGGSVLPQLLKTQGPLHRPADVMVLLDADLVVTAPLSPLVEAARSGRCALVGDPVRDRFYAEWGEVLGLGAHRREPYMNAGIIALPRAPGLEILELAERGQAHVDERRSMLAAGSPDNPFYFLDQDVWNAVISAMTEPDGLEVLEPRLAPHPPFRDLRVLSELPPRCAHVDGTQTLALHHVGRKPWLKPTRRNAYSRLLPPLLLTPGLTLTLAPKDVPLRFRRGPLATVERARQELLALGWSQRGKLGIRRRLAARRASRTLDAE
jgi:hypothetical protein